MNKIGNKHKKANCWCKTSVFGHYNVIGNLASNDYSIIEVSEEDITNDLRYNDVVPIHYTLMITFKTLKEAEDYIQHRMNTL